MFTLTVRDEGVYRQLMERVEQRGESLDVVLRELLEYGRESEEAQETPALKLLKLIDATDLPFERPFDARDAEDILARETGQAGWRTETDDDGAA